MSGEKSGAAADNKFKENSPADTVARARGILHGLGILTREHWMNPLDGFYSVNLSVAGAPFGVNGKGTSPEFALASAYGEFMERIQNQILMRYSSLFGEDVSAGSGFRYAPDEEGVPASAAAAGKALGELAAAGIAVPVSDRAAELLKEISDVSSAGELVSLPFSDAETGAGLLVPYPVLDIVFKSNGMSAGNSREEALVQGLSEIVERHVNRQLLKGGVTPPDVPAEFIARFPACAAMIAEITRSGNFSLTVKDCSLGQGYPVVGVLFVDRDTQRYFVKFGSHPSFAIALERTLTELMQGKNIKNMSGLKPFYASGGRYKGYSNWVGIYADGSGHYPPELFAAGASYPFSEGTFCRSFGNNAEMFSWMKGLLAEKGFRIFLRDVSFLGFPAYHILVPGMSCVLNEGLEGALEYGLLRYRTAAAVRDLDACDEEDLRAVMSMLARGSYGNSDNIGKLAWLPLLPGFRWESIRTDLFLSAANWRLGLPGEASKAMDRFLSDMGDSLDQGSRTYYGCVRDVLACFADGRKPAEAEALLCRVYPPKLLKAVLDDLSSPEKIFRYYGRLSCPDCDACPAKGRCAYPKAKDIQLRLKEKYAAWHAACLRSGAVAA